MWWLSKSTFGDPMTKSSPFAPTGAATTRPDQAGAQLKAVWHADRLNRDIGTQAVRQLTDNIGR